MDVRHYNREAWNRQVDGGNPWTIPVTPEEIARARAGEWQIILTPTRPVPKHWFPPITDADILCLASGGGQQGPILAAAGAHVTVFDNSPRQLEQDNTVAAREGLDLTTVEGDMCDLSCFEDESFDLIVHPVSNVFVPGINPVWREAWRVLRTGACLIAGFDNPVSHLFDEDARDRGELVVSNRIPCSHTASLTPEELAQRKRDGAPLEFGHTLDDQIGGQTDCGLWITGFYEDRYPPEEKDPVSEYIAIFIVTRAVKSPAQS